MRTVLLVMVLSGSASWAVDAQGETAGPEATVSAAPAARPRVVLSVVADAPTREKLAASLAELLDRLKVSLVVGDGVVTADQASSPALATATADFSEAEHCLLTVDDAEGRLGLRRRISGAPSVLVEAAAHVIHSAIEELVLPRRQSLAAPPIVAVEPPPAVERPAPALLRPRESGLDVGIEAGARGVAAQVPAAVNLGVNARAHTLLRGRDAGVTFGLGLIPELDTSQLDVELHAQLVSLRALFSLTLLGSERWGLEAGAGGGADLLLSRIASLNRLKPFRFDAAGVLTAGLTLRVAIAENADFFASALVDVDPSPIEYVAHVGTTVAPVLTSWPVRPALVLGVRFAPWGRSERAEVAP